MNCTFVYFDIGYTLLRATPSVGYHYARVAREYGLSAQAERLDASFVAAWHAARKSAAITDALPYGRDAEEAVRFWTVVVRNVFTNAGYEAPPSEYYQRIFDEFAKPACWELYPDVEEAFSLLEENGVRFGALSNFDPRIHGILEGTGLRPRLSRVVISSEVGAEKPARAIFKHAAAILPPEERLRIGLVGDEPGADGFGAVRAGWTQCLVVRHPGVEVPATLRSESDLVSAVRRLIGHP